MRKEGTRVIVRLAETVAGDPVVRDAVAAGRGLCAEDGSLARVHEVVRARDDAARAFFEQPREADVTAMPLELPAYLTALAPSSRDGVSRSTWARAKAPCSRCSRPSSSG